MALPRCSTIESSVGQQNVYNKRPFYVRIPRPAAKRGEEWQRGDEEEERGNAKEQAMPVGRTVASASKQAAKVGMEQEQEVSNTATMLFQTMSCSVLHVQGHMCFFFKGRM